MRKPSLENRQCQGSWVASTPPPTSLCEWFRESGTVRNSDQDDLRSLSLVAPPKRREKSTSSNFCVEATRTLKSKSRQNCCTATATATALRNDQRTLPRPRRLQTCLQRSSCKLFAASSMIIVLDCARGKHPQVVLAPSSYTYLPITYLPTDLQSTSFICKLVHLLVVRISIVTSDFEDKHRLPASKDEFRNLAQEVAIFETFVVIDPVRVH